MVPVPEEAPKGSVGRRRVLALVLLVPIAVATAAWAITYTPLFEARHIRVEGAVSLRPDAVRSLAGIEPSTNVFHLQTQAVTASLLERPVDRLGVGAARPARHDRALDRRARAGRDDRRHGGGVDPRERRDDPARRPRPRRRRSMRSPRCRPRSAPPTWRSGPRRRPCSARSTRSWPSASARCRWARTCSTSLTLRDGVTVDAGMPGDEAEKAVALRAVLRWAASGGHRLVVDRRVRSRLPRARRSRTARPSPLESEGTPSVTVIPTTNPMVAVRIPWLDGHSCR